MILPIAFASLALAALYAGVTLLNLVVFRAPPERPGRPPARVSVLIPARDEAANIGAAVDAVLANRDVELDLVVLDDGSTDATPQIAAGRARADARLRLIEGAALPAGWNGKQHACWRLAAHARHPVLVFVDADVRLAPDALARTAAWMEDRRLDLASGFPRQVTGTLAEALVVPQILVLLLGYLPLPLARVFRNPAFAAGCGQLMAVRRDAYVASGGHSALRESRHDGLLLPRRLREGGWRTDIFDAAALAHCRMYNGWSEVWSGFGKNATEGMAKPVALPVWTVLLGGGHVLPVLLAPLAWVTGAGDALALSLGALALVYAARGVLALRTRQPLLSVILHPLGIVLALAIQWSALIGASRRRPVTWRGRTYDA